MRVRQAIFAALKADSASANYPAASSHPLRSFLTGWLVGHGFLTHRENTEEANA